MDLKKISVIVLALLMMTGQAFVTFALFPQGTAGFLTCTIAAAIIANALAILGQPVTNGVIKPLENAPASLVLAFTLLANTCGALTVMGPLKQGTPLFMAVGILGMVSSAMLAFFGKPLAANALNKVALLLPLGLGVLFISGCQCFQAAHRNDPGCAVVHQIVDCSEATVVALLPELKPLVLSIIQKYTNGDGTVDWVAVGKEVGVLGIKDGGCVLADIQNDYLTNKTAGPKAKAYLDGIASYRAQHWPGVKFKFVVDGKTVLR